MFRPQNNTGQAFYRLMATVPLRNQRPPNILIYTKGNQEEFFKWRTTLQCLLEPDRLKLNMIVTN